MKQRLLSFLYYFLYWILFFVAARLIFLIYNHALSFSLTAGEWISTFWWGMRMDASMSGYISFIAALLLTVTTFSRGTITGKIMSAYTAIILPMAAILVVADMELYRHWGFRLDSTPLSYLKTPKEAFASVNIWALAIQLAVLVLLAGSFWMLYRKLIRSKLICSKSAGFKGIPVFLFAGALMILPIRGSLGIAPMNVGFVYFHPDNIFANHAAVNVMWNAGKSLMETDKISDYRFMDDGLADEIFAQCYPPQPHTQIFLKNNRPNVVLIIMESFSNRIIEPLGGLQGITPNLNRLCQEGIVFSNLYANSDRTDKGILGVLSGYPAHPVVKIFNFPEKIRQLPSLSVDMKNVGYHTGFIHGGDIRYSNFASYFTNAGYDKLITREDFPAETYRGTKWGVPDHWVFEKLLDECNHADSPFFNVFMALSSHEPFEVPMPTAIEGDSEESLFLNSAFYSDKALGDFIEAAKKSEWWDNTLIVVTADHGSRHPGNVSVYEPAKFNIPMLWLGGAIAKSDTTITTIASQTDIPLTILRQLGLENDGYHFSRDILGMPVYPFAFYDFNNGFGFVASDTKIAFDNVSGKVIFQEGTQIEKMTEKGKAYLQIFSRNFKTKEHPK